MIQLDFHTISCDNKSVILFDNETILGWQRGTIHVIFVHNEIVFVEIIQNFVLQTK